MTQLPFEDLPKRRNGTRLSPQWIPTDQDMAYAESLGMSADQITLEAEKFRDYWISLPGQRATKLNWAATWRNWLRKDYAKGQPVKHDPSGHTREQLEIIAAHVRKPWCERGAYSRDVLEQCVKAELLTEDEAEAVL